MSIEQAIQKTMNEILSDGEALQARQKALASKMKKLQAKMKEAVGLDNYPLEAMQSLLAKYVKHTAENEKFNEEGWLLKMKSMWIIQQYESISEKLA